MLGRVRAAWNAMRGYAAAQDSRASAWAAERRGSWPRPFTKKIPFHRQFADLRIQVGELGFIGGS